ncbi:MAG: hypothetical protein UIB31_01440 [Methanobrevibacter sp.]|nr:hypothetical protein [Methanobrevibacter sp.]
MRHSLSVQTFFRGFPDTFTGESGYAPLRIGKGKIFKTDATLPGNRQESTSHVHRFLSSNVPRNIEQSPFIDDINQTRRVCLYPPCLKFRTKVQ